MSAERLRAMLSEATLPWKINWYENGGVESIDLGESDFISTDGTFYGPNPQNARLIAIAPDAIALLASEEFALLLRWVAILYREVEDGGRANDEMVPIRASDLYNLGQAAEPVRAALDALCGDDQ